MSGGHPTLSVAAIMLQIQHVPHVQHLKSYIKLKGLIWPHPSTHAGSCASTVQRPIWGLRQTSSEFSVGRFDEMGLLVYLIICPGLFRQESLKL